VTVPKYNGLSVQTLLVDNFRSVVAESQVYHHTSQTGFLVLRLGGFTDR